MREDLGLIAAAWLAKAPDAAQEIKTRLRRARLESRPSLRFVLTRETDANDVDFHIHRLQIHYYSRGPMGYGMGVLDIIRHDGRGGLRFEHRPYVVMNDEAFVDLGVVRRW